VHVWVLRKVGRLGGRWHVQWKEGVAVCVCGRWCGGAVVRVCSGATPVGSAPSSCPVPSVLLLLEAGGCIHRGGGAQGGLALPRLPFALLYDRGPRF